MKDHLQKVWYRNIHPALRYRVLISLAKSGTEPQAGMKPLPGAEPLTDSQRHEGSFAKGLVQNIHPAPRYSSKSHCDAKRHKRKSKRREI